MPPSPNNVDGIKPPATAPTGPPQRPAEQAPVAAPAAPTAPQHNTVDLKAAAAEASAQPALPKANPKVSKKNGGPVVIILFTLIVMVLLIALAYFAYSKSK